MQLNDAVAPLLCYGYRRYFAASSDPLRCNENKRRASKGRVRARSTSPEGGTQMIHVGVDLHHRFCYMTALEARGKTIQSGAVNNERLALRRYFRQFRGQAVQVAVEACGFWPAFREVVEPEVARLVLVHPQRVKAIASAKLKNDRVDSETLAHLLRCDLLPESWKADRETQARRQQVRLRATLVRHRTRVKNQVHAVLHQQGLHSPVTDLFGKHGRLWLAGLKLPAAARESVSVCL